MSFWVRDKSHPSAGKGAPSKEPATPRPSVPPEVVVESIRSRRICYPLVLGISSDLKGYSFVRNHTMNDRR